MGARQQQPARLPLVLQPEERAAIPHARETENVQTASSSRAPLPGRAREKNRICVRLRGSGHCAAGAPPRPMEYVHARGSEAARARGGRVLRGGGAGCEHRHLPRPQGARRRGSGGRRGTGAAIVAVILTGFEGFARELLPKLVYHLESIGAHLPQCRGVVISAFAGERLYFIEAGKFVSRACRMLGITTDELVRRHGTGERRTAVPSEPLLLPGPKGDA